MSTRDQRFVAVHRGGPLDRDRHQLLALWAADCADHILPFFEKHASDARPRLAIEVGRAWARGEVSVGDAQTAAVGAHAAARAAQDPAAIAAARSAGHAVATAHMADHCLGAASYALKAFEAGSGSLHDEYAWQVARLPESVRELVVSGIALRFPKLAAKLR